MEFTKKEVLNFLSAMEGYHSLLKTIHWSTTNEAEHKLSDSIDENILEYEDRIAEATMGKLNTRFGVGDLKTLMPEAKTLDSMLKELETDIIKFKETIGENIKYSGMHNILDEFMEDIYKWNYLRTLK